MFSAPVWEIRRLPFIAGLRNSHICILTHESDKVKPCFFSIYKKIILVFTSSIEYYIMKHSETKIKIKKNPDLQDSSLLEAHMTIDLEDLLNSILASLDRISHIPSKDIPNIDLYMDQVTTFMDKRLRSTTRNPKEDKILTKTMINNYAKNDLLPPPVKKKYTKDHMIMLIFIYYFKGILSISDIQAILGPLAERFFHTDGTMNMQTIYDEAFGMEQEHVQALKKSIEEDYQIAQETFADAGSDDREFLQFFSFISLMSYDVYVKKLLVEKMIDGYTARKKSAGEAGKKSEEAAKGEDAKKGEKAAKSGKAEETERAGFMESAQDEQAKRVKSMLEAQTKEET